MTGNGTIEPLINSFLSGSVITVYGRPYRQGSRSPVLTALYYNVQGCLAHHLLLPLQSRATRLPKFAA